MARPERLTKKLVCPKCHKTGEAEFEENVTPPHHAGQFNTRMVSVSDGFMEAPQVDQSNDPQPVVLCKKCKVKVY